jgi:integrase
MSGLTFLGLRPSGTTAMVDLGVHPTVISERLGHPDPRTSLVHYTRRSRAADAQASKRLEEHLIAAVYRRGTVTPR